MRNLIVTVTANPAIDLNFTADRLAFDDRAYLLARSEAAGGRGIKASLLLHSLGAPTLAIERFEGFLRFHGFPVELVRIRRAIRTNYSITDRQGLTVKLDERGPELEPDEVRRLEETVLRALPKAAWLLICGSLPPGVPSDFYRRIIEQARAAKVSTLLDADRGPLQEGLEAGPTLVAPNLMEAERLLNRALVTRSHFYDAVRRIQELGAESVILSLGSRGVVAAYGSAVFEVIPPTVDAICSIGAGDALNAAFVWSVSQGKDFAEALRWGVAAGTASARLPGLDLANRAQIEEILAGVEVREVTRPAAST